MLETGKVRQACSTRMGKLQNTLQLVLKRSCCSCFRSPIHENHSLQVYLKNNAVVVCGVYGKTTIILRYISQVPVNSAFTKAAGIVWIGPCKLTR